MPPPTYYDRLGVPADAPPDAIAAAFRERALVLHPDVEGGDAAEFRALADAYATLRDPAQRALYDASIGLGCGGGGGGFGPPPPGERGFDDSFDAAFDRWWRAQGFAPSEPDPAAKARAARMDVKAAEAAWAAELRDAAAAKDRFQRQVHAARAARAQRHAAVLRRVWVATPRVAWFDGVAVVGLVAALAGVAAAWPRRRVEEEAGGDGDG